VPPRAVCPLAFPYPVLRSPAFPTSQPSREILPIAGQQNKRAVAVTNQQWLARACPPEFGSNHGLVWLMIGYSRDQPTSVPVRARSVDTLIADIAKRPPTGPRSATTGLDALQQIETSALQQIETSLDHLVRANEARIADHLSGNNRSEAAGDHSGSPRPSVRRNIFGGSLRRGRKAAARRC